MELARGHLDELPHPPVHVDAEDLEPCAAVAPAAPAGDAPSAFHVGLEGAAVAGPQARATRGRLEQLHAQLVAEDARVGEKRLVALDRVEIGAADADPPDADQGLLGSERPRRRTVGGDEPARLLEHDLLHARLV